METDEDNNAQQESVPGNVLDGDFAAGIDGAQVRSPGLGPGELAVGRGHE